MSKDLYRYIITQTKDGRMKTIAISTYAGKSVRGIAICDPGDVYDELIGKQIAATRCSAKIAKKRRNRARRELNKAHANLKAALNKYDDMAEYYEDACNALRDAEEAIEHINWRII